MGKSGRGNPASWRPTRLGNPLVRLAVGQLTRRSTGSSMGLSPPVAERHQEITPALIVKD